MITPTRIMLLLTAGGCLTVAFAAIAQNDLRGRTYSQDPAQQAAEAPTGDTLHDYPAKAAGKAYADQVLGAEHEEYEDTSPVNEETFPLLLQAAQAGDAQAMGLVGEAYHYGYAVEANAAAAAEWYGAAIERGETQYYAPLGSLYRDYEKKTDSLFGNFFSGDDIKDNVKAREIFEAGVQAGDARSYMELGVMYRDGAGGLEKDMDKANFYYDTGLRAQKEENARAEAEYRKLLEAQGEAAYSQ